jgi:hypothetical protein
MTDPVGRGRYELEVDRSRVKPEMEAAGKDIAAVGAKTEQEFTGASERSVSKLGSMTRAGVTAVSGAATALFAIATKGAIDLENAQSRYTAETGATADEARRAGDAINAMAGRNLQGVEAITDTLIGVTKTLGLTGQEAEDTTELFLRFATATGQDAAGAVGAFDDILDGFGLTADDAAGLMDKLVVSSQRYGTSVGDLQSALGSMAPQLQALNMTADDGIEILNLFAASGLDAASAQRTLNAAVQNLPADTTLDEFVAELAAIEDPALRAARASEVFGSKAGVGMANAIKPGMASLDDLGVSVEEAAGATDRAADAIEGTLQNKLSLAFKNFGSTITSVLGQGGPVLASLGTLGSLGTSIVSSLKLDDALSGGFRAAFGGLRTRLPEIFASVRGDYSDFGGAGGEVYGDAFAEGGSTAVVEGAQGTIAGNLASQRVYQAYEKAGKEGGRNYGRALMLGVLGATTGAGVAAAQGGGLMEQILGGIVGGVSFASLPTAIAKIGGAVTALGISAAAAGPPLLVLGAALPALAVAIDAFSAEGQARTSESLRLQQEQAAAHERTIQAAQAAAAAEAGYSRETQIHSAVASAAWGAHANYFLEGGATIEQAIDELRQQGWTEADIDRLRVQGRQAANALVPSEQLVNANWQATQDAMSAGARGTIAATSSSIRAGEPVVRRAGNDAIWDPMMAAIRATVAGARERAEQIPVVTAEGIRSGRDRVRAASAALKWAQEHPFADTEYRNYLIGQLGGRGLARGLRSTDPQVRAAAQAKRAVIRDELSNLPTYVWGQTAGQQYAAGLRWSQFLTQQASAGHAATVARYLRLRSPAQEGPLSEGGGPEGWGSRGAELFAKGWSARAMNLRTAISGAVAPALSPLALNVAGSQSIQVGGTVQVRLSGDTIAAARAQGATWDDVGRMGAAASVDLGGVLGHLGRLARQPVVPA